MKVVNELTSRGVTNVIPDPKKLEDLLSSGKKLNVYLGIDPTATRLHLGNAVPLRKLQQFVEAGHNVTFLIGDFTALVGDTSDKDSERPILSPKEIGENFKTYKNQAEKILDFSKVSLRFNSEWLGKLTLAETIRLMQQFSLGDFISRELIKKRLAEGKKVRFDENLYPVMQGYDSFMLDTDIQIGGADQTFNMQAGRTLLKNLKHKESFVLVTGYIEGTDGRKMSKSWGNAIWLEDEPGDMFGKAMSIKDNLIINYFTLATNWPEEEIQKRRVLLDKGENPMRIKLELAHQIVSELHNKKAADEAKKDFEKTFRKGEPEYSQQIEAKGALAGTISSFTSLASISDAKRLIRQGGVDVNGKTVNDPNLKVKSGDEIKVGKKTFLKVK
ncbi:tyrosine--tRNA ligase [Candidatus Woesebacteria bacterium]|nr:tyrosine--tRNA ligase [Candidatus Woesebacteria bacterium]